jgi:hypothetical protein
MKTPREILLAQHRQSEKKLDAIREEVVTTMLSRQTKNANHKSLLVVVSDQVSMLLRFRSRAWITLAPLWIIIVALKLSTQDSSRVIASRSSISPEIVREVRQQKFFFAELIGTTDSHDADRSKAFAPRPRSEIRFGTIAV